MPQIISKKNIIIFLSIILGLIAVYYSYEYYKKSQDIIPVDHEIVGDNFLKEYKYSEAATEYKIYLQQNDKNVSGYLKLSEIYWKKNLTNEAIDLLKICIEKCSFNSSALSRIINYTIQTKDFDTAYSNLEELSKQIGSEDTKNKNSIAILKLHILNSQNKFEEGVNSTKSFIDETSSTDPHLNFYISAYSYKDINTSKRYLTNFADYQNNKYFVILNNILDEIQKDGQNINLNTSIANIARILVVYSYDPDFFVNLLSEQIKLPYYNLYPLSTNLLDNVISASPEYYSTYQLRGIAHYLNSNLNEAEADFTKTLQLEPTDKISLLYLARINDRNSNTQKSIAFYNSILDITQNDPSIFKEYAEVLKNYGFYTQSAEKYKELIKISGQNKSNFINVVDYTNLLVTKLNRFSEVEPQLNTIINQWEEKSIWKREERPDLYKQIDFNLWYAKYQLTLSSLKGKFDSKGLPLENIEFYKNELKLIEALDEIYPNDVKIIYNIALLQIQIGELEELKEISDKTLLTASDNLKKVINLDLNNEFTANAKENIEILKNK